MMNEYNELLKRIEKLEFKQNLLLYNDEVSRVIFEYDFSKEQYDKLMDLLDSYRNKIRQGKTEGVNNAQFERDVYEIIPEHKGNYHMCETILYTMKEANRWEEVFDIIYGDMPKYRFLKGK